MAKYKDKNSGAIVEARLTTATPYTPATGNKPAVKAVDEVIEDTGVSIGPGHYVVTPLDDKGNKNGPQFCPSELAFNEQYELAADAPVGKPTSKAKAEDIIGS